MKKGALEQENQLLSRRQFLFLGIRVASVLWVGGIISGFSQKPDPETQMVRADFLDAIQAALDNDELFNNDLHCSNIDTENILDAASGEYQLPKGEDTLILGPTTLPNPKEPKGFTTRMGSVISNKDGDVIARLGSYDRQDMPDVTTLCKKSP